MQPSPGQSHGPEQQLAGFPPEQDLCPQTLLSVTDHGWSPWGELGNTSYPSVFNLLEISESIILSEEENRLVPTHTGKDLCLPGQHQRKPHV